MTVPETHPQVHNQYRSAFEGVKFPAIPIPIGANLATVLYQLEQSQWWSPEVMRRQQFNQLGLLLRHAYLTVPFYRERLDAAGYRPGQEVNEALWSSLPILTRAELQARGSELHSRQTPPTHGKCYPTQSSGSTGRAVRTLATDLTRFFWQAITLRDVQWHRTDLSLKLAAIRPDRKAEGNDGRVMPSWGVPVDLLYHTGPSVLLNSHVDVQTQLAWLVKHQPDYLLTLPSNLQELIRLSTEQGVRLPRLREVHCFSENVTPELRQLVQEQWQIPLRDMYSAQEVGYMALQCPEHDTYHVQSEVVLMEVLDAEGKPCAPGESGRVVVTPLHNFALPLIRYEIMDYAEVGEPCPCGRGLPVLKRILGRSRNMATSPDGRRFWPSFPSEKWLGIAPVRQIQLVQTSLDQIEVTLAMDGVLTPEQRERFTSALHKCLNNYPYRFEFRCVDVIPRHPNGKYEDFISRLDQGSQG